MTATQSNGQPAATDIRKTDDLHSLALNIRREITQLQADLDVLYERRMQGLTKTTGAGDIRDRIADLEHQLDLIIAEYLDHRRI